MVHRQRHFLIGERGEQPPRLDCDCRVCEDARRRSLVLAGQPFNLTDVQAVRGFWYLGTPFTHYPGGIDDAYMMACTLNSVLTAHRVPLYCPIAQHCDRFGNIAGVDLLDVEFWMRITAPLRRAACGLIVGELKGWERSAGLRQERREFSAEGKPIYHLNRVALAELVRLLRARPR